MGKKPQKTKELSVAIAEASSTGGETEQQQSQPHQIQPQAPRKRGRPRKIVVKTESDDDEEKKLAPSIEQASTAAEISSIKKGEASEEEHVVQGSSSSAIAYIGITKEEGVSEEMQVPKGEPSPPRSRARRKSKPRKST